MEHDTKTPKGLKAARLALGLTQDALAAAIGIHRVTLANYELGSSPTPPAVALAVECLGWRATVTKQKSA